MGSDIREGLSFEESRPSDEELFDLLLVVDLLPPLLPPPLFFLEGCVPPPELLPDVSPASLAIW
jgi:hypothetical protein